MRVRNSSNGSSEFVFRVLRVVRRKITLIPFLHTSSPAVTKELASNFFQQLGVARSLVKGADFLAQKNRQTFPVEMISTRLRKKTWNLFSPAGIKVIPAQPTHFSTCVHNAPDVFPRAPPKSCQNATKHHFCHYCAAWQECFAL